MLRTFDTIGCIFLDSEKAQVFSQDSLRDTTDDLRESMYNVGTVAMDLNEKQKERLARKAQEEQERKCLAAEAEQEENPEDDDGDDAPVAQPKGGARGGRAGRGRGRGRKWPKAVEIEEQEQGEDDDNKDADRDWFPETAEQDTDKTRKRKTPSILQLVGLTEQGYKTTKETRCTRYEAKRKEEEEVEPDEEELERQRVIAEQKERLRETQRQTRAQTKEKKKEAKAFQDCMVSTIATAKKGKLRKIELKKEQEEVKDMSGKPLPEGHRNLPDHVHCKNIRAANGFQQYVREIIKQFEKVVREGKNVAEEYRLIIQSVFWACKVVGVAGTRKADVDEVFAAIKDKECAAWRMKLKGRKFLKPDVAAEYDEEEEAVLIEQPWRPPNIDELLKEEIANKTPLQLDALNRDIKAAMEHQQKAHRHAADSLEKMEVIRRNTSIPTFLRIADALYRPLVVMRLPSVDDALDESLKIKRQREETRREYENPIEDVAMFQNVPRCNKEWEFIAEGKATRMLAAIVTRYIHERINKDTAKVLSAKSLHKKFGIAESSLGKVISGRQYKGGKEIGEYVLDEEEIEIEDDIELEPAEGTSGLEPVLKKGKGKKTDRKRQASEIRKDQQKKKRKKG